MPMVKQAKSSSNEGSSVNMTRWWLQYCFWTVKHTVELVPFMLHTEHGEYAFVVENGHTSAAEEKEKKGKTN